MLCLSFFCRDQNFMYQLSGLALELIINLILKGLFLFFAVETLTYLKYYCIWTIQISSKSIKITSSSPSLVLH